MTELSHEHERLVRDISNKIEDELKKKYTWISILVATLLGGGMYSAFNVTVNNAESRANEAREKVIRAEAQIDTVRSIVDKEREKFELLIKESKDEQDRLSIQFASISSKLDEIRGSLGSIEKKYADLGSREVEVFNLKKLIEDRESEMIRIIDQIGSLKQIVDFGQNGKLKEVRNIAQMSVEKMDKSKYSIFIHYRKEGNISSEYAKNVGEVLRSQGYVVADMSPNSSVLDKRDGARRGPFIQYFAPVGSDDLVIDQSRRFAEEIKFFINKIRLNSFSEFELYYDPELPGDANRLAIWF